MARNLCYFQQISIIPFEVFCDGYWHWTDNLGVKNGVISFASVRDGLKSEKPIGSNDIRLRSKKAMASDCCHCFLRPGIEICVHVRGNEKKKQEDPNLEKDPVFQDGRIISIARQTHEEDRCNCVFYVKYYRKEVNGNNRKSIPGEDEITIESIYILQKLRVDPCREVGKRSWKLSENCAFLRKSRLLTGHFGSEFAWMIVLSIEKGMQFLIKLVGDMIVYLIRDSPDLSHNGDVPYPRTGTEIIRILSLETVDGKVVPRIGILGCIPDADSDALISHHVFGPRRSDRLKTAATAPSLENLFDQQQHRGKDLYRGKESSCCHPSKHGGRKRKSGEVVMEIAEEDGKRRASTRSNSHHSSWDHLMGDCVSNIKTKMRRKPEVGLHVDASYYAGPMTFDWEASCGEEEEREHEDLWKEMEYAISMLPFLEDMKETNTSESSEKDLNVRTDSWENSCRHSPFLDEERGIVCRFCKSGITERRFVLPSFATETRRRGDREGNIHSKEDPFHNIELHDAICRVGSSKQATSSSSLLPHGNKDVWGLIPELEPKLHPHQKEAFEFLWRNIGGSLNHQISDSNPPPNSGGCIISHSPGTGKTFLVVSFLVSYLRTFDGQRPLILAPKIAISVWVEEFRKWQISIPIYTIHPLHTFRKTCRRSSPGRKPPSLRRRHTLDILEKLSKWHDQPSVLLMSYSSFSLLAEEDGGSHGDPRRTFISDVLRKSPGLLILDEGHNPRSTRSKLRTLLMKVATHLRVLLSGTPFQNNFVEYFNTLCLARPSFVTATTKEFKLGGGRRAEEDVVRRAFVRKIGRRLESKEETTSKKAFCRLMEMTRSFVHVHFDHYAGSSTLPGLKVYTLLLKSTSPQKKILDRLHDLRRRHRYSWEIEVLITLASIHPSLVTSISTCRKSNYFDEGELRDLSKLGDNHCNGSKLRFLVEMVHKCTSTKREKLLVFCHNIAPIVMIVETLGRIFGWKEGREIFVLQGKQDVFVRESTIAKFKEACSSKVMLASTTACSEGISLTAASRVLLMDSEWNYSKTQQAIGRAFRPGQEKVVYVYQLLAAETLEEDKYRLNEKKEWMSKMIATAQYVQRFDTSLVRQLDDHDDDGDGDGDDDEILKSIVDEENMKVFCC